MARKHGVSVSSVAIRYVLDCPAVAAAIVGARNADHLDETLAALAVSLDEDDRAAIEVALAGGRVPAGDIYELECDASGLHARMIRYNLNAAPQE